MARIKRLTQLKMNLTSMPAEPGALPYERLSPTRPEDLTYLHSSIHGFNADYQKVIDSINLSSTFEKLKNQTYTISQTNIKILQEISQDFIIQHCQGPNVKPGQELETSDFGRLILGTNDEEPSVAALTVDVKKVLNWYTFEDEVIKQLNEDFNPTHAHKIDATPQRREQFYQDIGNRIGSILQQFQTKVVASGISSKELNVVMKTIDSLLTKAATDSLFWSNAIRSGELRKQLQECRFAQLLGYSYEETLTATINEALHGLYIAAREGLKDKLADIIVHGKTKQINTESPLQSANIELGISAKLRNKNSFSLSADLSFADAMNRVAQESDYTITQTLTALAFIYNNYIALATWNTDIESRRGMTLYTDKQGKQRRPSFRQRKQRLMGSNTLLGKFFKPLAEYVNYLMLNTSFFGNRLDANNVSLFNQQFFSTLYDQQRQGNAVPPALLITSDHIYETGNVFQYYLNQVHNGELLFTVSDIFGDVFSGQKVYTVSELQRLYNLKSDYIIQREGAIYDRLFQTPSIMNDMPTTNAFMLMMSATKGRTLKRRIILNTQY